MRAGLLLVGLALSGCGLLPPVAAPGDAQALVERDRRVYVALGARGLGVVDLRTGVERVAPLPSGFGSVDDVALEGDLLFALDAAPPGRLCCLSLPELAPVGPSRPVPVGPFSGVSAAGGHAVVSGGTSELTVHAYDHRGLGPERARLELGRGQPDALVAPEGDRAYVATHFSLLRATYGLTVLDLSGPTPAVRGALELGGAGFTPGATKPAGFPLGLALAGRERLLIAHGAGLAVVAVRDAPRVTALLDVGLAGVSVAARGELAAVVGEEADGGCAVAFVDLTTGAVLGRTALPGARPGRCAFAASGQLLVAGQAGGTIVLEPPAAALRVAARRPPAG